MPKPCAAYPDPHANTFRAAAAAVLGISPDMILAGNGSDEILTILTRAALSEGQVLAAPDPSYTLYPVLADLQGVRFVAVPWEGEWDLPIDGLLSARPGAILRGQPQCPSGTMVAPAKIDELARRFHGLILIDEAYVRFRGGELPGGWSAGTRMLSSRRSFSKGYSLAGLRFATRWRRPR